MEKDLILGLLSLLFSFPNLQLFSFLTRHPIYTRMHVLQNHIFGHYSLTLPTAPCFSQRAWTHI